MTQTFKCNTIITEFYLIICDKICEKSAGVVRCWVHSIWHPLKLVRCSSPVIC